MEEDSEATRKQNVKVQMLAEQEIVLLRQQILALRRALSDSEKEAGEMRKRLDREVNSIIIQYIEGWKCLREYLLYSMKQTKISRNCLPWTLL